MKPIGEQMIQDELRFGTRYRCGRRCGDQIAGTEDRTVMSTHPLSTDQLQCERCAVHGHHVAAMALINGECLCLDCWAVVRPPAMSVETMSALREACGQVVTWIETRKAWIDLVIADKDREATDAAWSACISARDAVIRDIDLFRDIAIGGGDG